MPPSHLQRVVEQMTAIVQDIARRDGEYHMAAERGAAKWAGSSNCTLKPALPQLAFGSRRITLPVAVHASSQHASGSPAYLICKLAVTYIEPSNLTSGSQRQIAIYFHRHTIAL